MTESGRTVGLGTLRLTQTRDQLNTATEVWGRYCKILLVRILITEICSAPMDTAVGWAPLSYNHVEWWRLEKPVLIYLQSVSLMISTFQCRPEKSDVWRNIMSCHLWWSLGLECNCQPSVAVSILGKKGFWRNNYCYKRYYEWKHFCFCARGREQIFSSFCTERRVLLSSVYYKTEILLKEKKYFGNLVINPHLIFLCVYNEWCF